ncbi:MULTISPECIES: restriction endonuclease subunit S [Enterococcus]|uniref:restriction endonuclease subunit S n=1 Tax=Enterococcus TaxID=1350 RepID=UPI002B4BA1DB|nr:restriction endonuclease subunit S [Enterococcus mundtii]
MINSDFMDTLLDGVEVVWTPLGEVADYEQPTKYLVKSQNYSDDFKTPVLTAGKTFILGYTDETNGIYNASKNPVIIFDDFTTANKWVDFDFKAKSSAMKMITSKNESVILLRYIYHWINTLPSGLIEGDHKRQWISNYSYKLIPIPPLNIQAEIVRILDTFTELTAELTAELAARKKQYTYYRDKLLTFEEGEVEWKALGEVTEFSNGKGHEKDIIEDGKYIVVNSKFISTDGQVAKYSNKQICPLIIDDILIVMSDLPNGKALSKTFIVDKNDKYTLNQRIGKISVKNKQVLLPKFLQYFLNRTPQLLKYNNGVGQTNLRKAQILGIQVPIPPLSEQERIVSILDKFDTLTTSITEGLPREIELRQKQYEYYRNMLLSFPKEGV